MWLEVCIVVVAGGDVVFLQLWSKFCTKNRKKINNTRCENTLDCHENGTCQQFEPCLIWKEPCEMWNTSFFSLLSRIIIITVGTCTPHSAARHNECPSNNTWIYLHSYALQRDNKRGPESTVWCRLCLFRLWTNNLPKHIDDGRGQFSKANAMRTEEKTKRKFVIRKCNVNLICFSVSECVRWCLSVSANVFNSVYFFLNSWSVDAQTCVISIKFTIWPGRMHGPFAQRQKHCFETFISISFMFGQHFFSRISFAFLH